MCESGMRGIMDLSFPFAPARDEREVQAEPRALTADEARVRGELRRVALALAVEKTFEAGALVAARLVVDDPAPALVVDEGAVDDHADPRAVRDAREAVFVARFA